MGRHLFVVRFKDKNGSKAFKTSAKSPKEAADRLRSKGRILSVRKVKRD